MSDFVGELAGRDEVQIREKDLDGGALLALVHAAVRAGVRVVVNDRVDVALAAGAFGVHLPERGMAVADVRAIAPRLHVGVSRHDPRAPIDGADSVQLGPIFATPGKGPALGVDALRIARGAHGARLVAVGGIETAAQIEACMAAGADAVAMIRGAWRRSK